MPTANKMPAAFVLAVYALTLAWILTGTAGRATADPPAPAPSAISFSASPGASNSTSSTNTATSLWAVSAGYLDDLHTKNADSHGYYSITYNSDVISTSGQPITIATPAAQDTVFQSAPNDTQPHVSLNNGLVSASGGIFDAVFRHPFSAGVFKAWLGTVDMDTTANFTDITYHGGIESPRIPVLDWLNAKLLLNGRANMWTYAGVCDENTNDTGGGRQPRDSGLFTYRTFIGAPVGRVDFKSSKVPSNETIEEYDRELVEQETSRNLLEGPALLAWFNQLATGRDQAKDRNAYLAGLTYVEKAVLIQGDLHAADLADPLAFRRDMSAFFNQTQESLNVACPIVTLWGESKGYYQITGSTSTSTRFTNLMTVNLQYFLSPKSNNGSWAKLSYEVGTDRAAPTVYNNFLALTVGATF